MKDSDILKTIEEQEQDEAKEKAKWREEMREDEKKSKRTEQDMADFMEAAGAVPCSPELYAAVAYIWLQHKGRRITHWYDYSVKVADWYVLTKHTDIPMPAACGSLARHFISPDHLAPRIAPGCSHNKLMLTSGVECPAVKYDDDGRFPMYSDALAFLKKMLEQHTPWFPGSPLHSFKHLPI